MREPERPPAEAVLLGAAAMAPLVAGAALAWVGGPGWLGPVAGMTVLWAGAILIFLAGVPRGLSFRQPGGATGLQRASMLGLFAVGLGALAWPSAEGAIGLLMLGYLALAVLDPVAARRGEAPPFLAPLRPVQTAVGVAALAALLLRVVLRD